MKSKILFKKQAPNHLPSCEEAKSHRVDAEAKNCQIKMFLELAVFLAASCLKALLIPS
jgi:hypothetical protein